MEVAKVEEVCKLMTVVNYSNYFIFIFFRLFPTLPLLLNSVLRWQTLNLLEIKVDTCWISISTKG